MSVPFAIFAGVVLVYVVANAFQRERRRRRMKFWREIAQHFRDAENNPG
jgi:hypothetical protein